MFGNLILKLKGKTKKPFKLRPTPVTWKISLTDFRHKVGLILKIQKQTNYQEALKSM